MKYCRRGFGGAKSQVDADSMITRITKYTNDEGKKEGMGKGHADIINERSCSWEKIDNSR
jgi:hypothetical protein